MKYAKRPPSNEASTCSITTTPWLASGRPAGDEGKWLTARMPIAANYPHHLERMAALSGTAFWEDFKGAGR